MMVEWGSLVKLDYDAFLDSGEEFDSSAAKGPLRFRVGEWRILPGLGEKLLGLQAGDERLIHLVPAEAFGEWDPGAVMPIHESLLRGDTPLEDGMTLRIEARGATAVCRVFRATEDRMLLDFNHPLAGQPVTLFVRVTEVLRG